MKKDIIIPIVKNIQVVATHEWDKDFLAKTWMVYLINNREDIIESVLVMSRGTNKNKKHPPYVTVWVIYCLIQDQKLN